MKKVLILNRGEIACRLIQACQELGLQTAAVYSSADKNSRHIELANESIHLPGSSPQETYLNLELILPQAKALGCDAVHPGYGFLSERAHAAELFIQSGVKWIGPSPTSIRKLGDKLEAKKILDQFNVPTTPWGEVSIDKSPELIDLAQKIGFPVLLKAASGGGGKGMRLVQNADDLISAAQSASREAKASFGDATLLLEKYVKNPRHVEIQILGDEHGTITHLGERECSLQRRHQKVVEEAPAPNLSQKTKEAIAASAVRLAQGVGYYNAGTVEYLVDEEENFYFLEVNSRLQVEHSVTEAVWGIDIVKAQIQIAQGKKISEILPLDKLQPRGHAIQCRIYAEDAQNQFAPCPGRLEWVDWPTAVGLRIDTSVTSGSNIGLDYDAMIAKLTVFDSNRKFALKRMLWCLQHSIIFGTVTNINYLQDILSHPKVQEGKMHVKFLETDFSNWKDPLPEDWEKLRDQAMQTAKVTQVNHGSTTTPISSPWEKK